MNRTQFNNDCCRSSDPAVLLAGERSRCATTAESASLGIPVVISIVEFETAVNDGMIHHAATEPSPALFDTALVAYYLNLT